MTFIGTLSGLGGIEPQIRDITEARTMTREWKAAEPVIRHEQRGVKFEAAGNGYGSMMPNVVEVRGPGALDIQQNADGTVIVTIRLRGTDPDAVQKRLGAYAAAREAIRQAWTTPAARAFLDAVSALCETRLAVSEAEQEYHSLRRQAAECAINRAAFDAVLAKARECELRLASLRERLAILQREQPDPGPVRALLRDAVNAARPKSKTLNPAALDVEALAALIDPLVPEFTGWDEVDADALVYGELRKIVPNYQPGDSPTLPKEDVRHGGREVRTPHSWQSAAQVSSDTATMNERGEAFRRVTPLPRVQEQPIGPVVPAGVLGAPPPVGR